MPTSIQTVLGHVAKKVVPGRLERKKMSRLAERLKTQVQSILDDAAIDGKVSVQGSYARDTWLSDETDLDIFASFSPSMDRQEWTQEILPTIRKGIAAKTIDRYAEHPYLEFRVDGIRVNVVPCYAVERGQWKSATDRTPFHTEYMREHLTSEMLLEARLLKRFMKGIRSYGAEIEVGGFSGMLVETLILHYRTFLETIAQVSNWKPIIFLDLEKDSTDRESRVREFGSELVVIDPVDPKRNLAAAVREDKLWGFVAASREFQRNPGIWYFFPPRPKSETKASVSRQISARTTDLVGIYFEHPRIVPDVLWGQLLKIEKALADLLNRYGFSPTRSAVWSDEARSSIVLLDMVSLTLPQVQTRIGPPVSKHDDSKGFLDRHLGAKDTFRGPWVQDGRWLVDKHREFVTAEKLVSVAVRDPRLGLSIPEQLSVSFRKSVRVLVNRKLLELLGREGFDQVLSEFLAAKPVWLRSHR